MIMEPTALIMYRCSTCGKWSHAQRRPKSHRRFVRDEGQGEPSGAVEYVEGEPLVDDPGGWMVVCGPFEPFQAVKVE
jgi:hypothetical protein